MNVLLLARHPRLTSREKVNQSDLGEPADCATRQKNRISPAARRSHPFSSGPCFDFIACSPLELGTVQGPPDLESPGRNGPARTFPLRLSIWRPA